MNNYLSFFFIHLLSLFLIYSPSLLCEIEISESFKGRILFLIQQGQHEQALKIYIDHFQNHQQHDFDLLHQIALGVLDYGYREKDPESQLLALFGAAVSAKEDVYYILEGSLKNRFPEIQLIALGALARSQTDKGDLALLRTLGSPLLEVRYEAAHQLCKKKHPQAVTQTESLMYKTPSNLMPLYPPLFAMIGDVPSTRILRKLLNQPSKTTPLAVILSIAKYERDDLLPQVRQRASHQDFALQEACAYTFGCLKDELAVSKLQKLTTSQYPSVALAAHLALYRLGFQESIKAIEEAARKGDIFAVSTLGELQDHSAVLIELLGSESIQLKYNAMIALLSQNHPRGLENINEIVLRDKRDLAFIATQSPGRTMKAWKVVFSANQLLKENYEAHREHLELKEELLKKIKQQSEIRFIEIAHQIFKEQQHELISIIVQLLEDLNTTEAINCLKEHQQQLGAPLVRQYCNLALYRLKEAGPYGDQLRDWVKLQNKTEFIRFKPVSPWVLNKNCYSLTPEETSKLLIEAFESFAIQQDKLGIEALIEAIAFGHKKNKFALAGLLLRATS